MIYSLPRSLVLFTPPKCASNTLHEVLTRQSCMSVIGPQFNGGVDIHTVVLPWDVTARLPDYTFAVSVRHPYTRVASLYGHYCRYWPSPHLSFIEFLRKLVVAPRFAFFNMTIAAMLEPLEQPLDGKPAIRVTRYVRVEHLAQDLRELGFDVPDELPRHHASVHRGLEEYTPEAVQLVDQWAYHDFQRFGYAQGFPLRT